MAANQPLAQRYREVAIKTANPLQLVVILYDGAIRSLQEAKERIKQKDIAGRTRCLNNSLAIISELQACLNFKEGGTIAGSLHRLYGYMQERIFKANIEQRAEPLIEVITLLEGLRSAWGELVVQSNNTGIPPAAPSPAAPGIIEGSTIGSNSLNITG